MVYPQTNSDNNGDKKMIHGVPLAASLVHLSKETKIDAFLSSRTKNSDVITELTKSIKAKKELHNWKLARDEGRCSVDGCNNNTKDGRCLKHGGKFPVGSKALKSKDERWVDKYNELVEHYKVNGPNVAVPRKQNGNVKLADW